ncbi:MAG TPA: nitrilase family protein [Chitinophagaceae bacterium]|jgi:predicted amidohydrolase|nr:nitrilase family protein [Chitinophagaceae bacterium]
MNPLSVTLIQSDLAWEAKETNLRRFEEKIRAIPGGTHVVVLPEMFSTGFSMRPEALAEPMDGPSVSWMRRMAAEKKVVLTGSLMIEEGGRYYNRLIWMLPNGQCGGYNKRHLFANGKEDQHYQPGDRRFIASVNGWKIHLAICYDLRFPVWSRQQYHRAEGFEYDVFLCVANWPDRRSHAWKTLLQARAIENQCYAVGVNRVGTDAHGLYHSGDSLVADPLGHLIYHKADAEDVHTVLLEREPLDSIREKLPFWKDADPFSILTA